MTGRLSATVTLLLALGACGSSAPGPDEVTTTVTEGDEEAWSAPDDPAPARDEAREAEPSEEGDEDDLEGD
jgi:hypothetical protein